jgi:hypothetical protein
MFPWGRLYFALDKNINPNPFGEGKYPLFDYIRDNKEPIAADQDSAISSPDKIRGRNLKLVFAAVGGCLLYGLERALIGLVSPHVLHKHAIASHQPMMDILFRMVHLFTLFPAQFAFFMVFAFLAVYRRRQPGAWIFASLAGFSLPYMFVHWLTFI